VLLEILALEARVVLAEITLGEIGRGFEPAAEKSAAERRISDIADAELAAGRDHFGLCVTAPQRKFGLHCDNWRRRIGGADGARRRFRKAEIPYFPFLLQPRHLADRILDRHVLVDAVL